MTKKSDEETIDPREAVRGTSAGSAARLEIEILFHSFLERVGDVFRVGAAGERRAAEIRIGRSAPNFERTGAPPGPLNDPCISRSQFTIRWSPALSVFAIGSDRGARRPIEGYRVDGSSLGPAPFDAPPGSLVAIGDRVLLFLAMREDEPSDDCRRLLLGNSGVMRTLRNQIRAVAALDETALVQGETGAGKELVAKAIHASSARRTGPYVTVNCAALPEALFESELFGHRAGAFTGAKAPQEGLFRAAHGGIIVLDEIGDLPLGMQAKLLRVLEERTVRPVGTSQPVSADTRVVAVTNIDLGEAVRAGRFRSDLHARLRGLCLNVPPLRARPEDVPLLFVRFLRKQVNSLEDSTTCRLFRDADDSPPPVPMAFLFKLLSWQWPQNVRELQKLAAAVVAANFGRESFQDVAFADSSQNRAQAAPSSGEREMPEADLLNRLLEEHDFALRHVAEALGVSHTTLDRWLQHHSIRRGRDLSAEDITVALRRASGDAAHAARALRVSERGFRLRAAELGLSALLDR
jgi:DNA-binding NtrC family response regulator